VKKLSDVQAHDLQLDRLREERGETPPELIETRAKKKDLEAQLTQRKLERDALRSRVNKNELELKALDARRKDASEAALRADSAKEASQYQNQELQFATRVQELEEDTMPMLEELDSMNAAIEALETQLAELEPVLADLSTTEEERLVGIDERIGTIQDTREAVAGAIDANLLRQYEQVRKARRGVGLVEVVDSQRCGGCNVRLPIHVVQKAKKGGDVTRCPSCGRILWNAD
jgi:predicted  nucleic acid-binding Zn-ribbon protein